MMAEYHQPKDSRYSQECSNLKEDKRLDGYRKPDETIHPTSQINTLGIYLPTISPATSTSSAYMDFQPLIRLDSSNVYARFTGSGQYQSGLNSFGLEQTYKNVVRHQQHMPSINALSTLSIELAAPDNSTLSDAELFWVQYHHGAHIGKDLFPGWKGSKEDDRPLRETIRLVPCENRSSQFQGGRLRLLRDDNGEVVRSDLTDEELFDLPFLPRYIDVKLDATPGNVENWIVMGADLRRDIIPRSHNYNQYYSDDEDGPKVFDWKATVARLQRAYTNKHLKRAEDPHIMGGLVRKFRMDKGRFAEFLTPVAFDVEGMQRNLLISMENLLFNTRWDIDMVRMVMRNPYSHQELPLFTPTEVRPAVRECLEKQGYKVHTLCDLWEKYPHIAGYDESKHPLFRRAQEHDLRLRQNWELLVSQRGNKKPPVTNTKPHRVNRQGKQMKDIKNKRKQFDMQDPENDYLNLEDSNVGKEQPSKRRKGSEECPRSFQVQPSEPKTLVAQSRRSTQSKTLQSPLLLHQRQHEEQRNSQRILHQQTPLLQTFRDFPQTPMNFLLQPLDVIDTDLNFTFSDGHTGSQHLHFNQVQQNVPTFSELQMQSNYSQLIGSGDGLN
jgi:hypothetical protein